MYDNVTDSHDHASFTRVILDPVSTSSGLLVGIPFNVAFMKKLTTLHFESSSNTSIH